MIQDLHSHTRYSFCGSDNPEEPIKAAIQGGIEVFGINDHQYGVAGQRPGSVNSNQAERLHDYQRCLDMYLQHQHLLKEKFKDQIRIQCGIEICTLNDAFHPLPDGADISRFDYCLIENIDSDATVAEDIFAYAKRCGCPYVGIAHTDLKRYILSKGENLYDFFSRMAEQNLFWEMNVTYDSIHNFSEHAYVKDFFEDTALQDAVRKSGLRLSVGFDGHRVKDYLPERIADFCRRITQLEIPLMYE